MSNENMTMQDILADSDTAIKVKVIKPRQFAVIIHNDDFTPMDFVIHILNKIFQKTHDEAVIIMLKVHHEGNAIVGLYSKEVAEQKAYETMKTAEMNEYPLSATFEEYNLD